MNRVEVTWLDAGCEHEHLDIERAPDITLMERMNVGYLLTDNDERVVLCFGTIQDHDHNATTTSDTLVIPRGDVKRITPLFPASG